MSGTDARPDDRHPRPRRWAAPTSAAAVAITVVIIVLAVGRSGHSATEAGPAGSESAAADGSSSAAPASTPPAPTSSRLIGDAAAWADFPVNATPRPVVLLGQVIDDPHTGFHDGDSKLAYIEGRLKLATTLPDAPATQDGYELRSAAAAVHLMQNPEGKNAPTSATLQITDIQLVEHIFPTDRGERALPAWQFGIAGVDDPAFVLAIAPSEQFDPVPGRGDGGPSITVGADGRDLTVPFIARHTSTGPCDAGFTQTLQVIETPNVVVLNVQTIIEQPSAAPSPAACGLVGHIPQPDPGQPATRTVSLDHPLGARVVIDGHGVPFAATS
jgi:hypothetical protein